MGQVSQINGRTSWNEALGWCTVLSPAGGPSHIHARYHVNTLIYSMASKFHGECHFINASVIQENSEGDGRHLIF